MDNGRLEMETYLRYALVKSASFMFYTCVGNLTTKRH